MSFQLSQAFYFEASHTLDRSIEADSSKRIHGHTYHAQVSVTGKPDPKNGMVLDLGILRLAIASVREQLDHHLLDEVQTLGPATLENLCHFIYQNMLPYLPVAISSVTVERRAGGDKCTYYPPSVGSDSN
jgi:6-pyruvoyltetrahydropterin/6-carboxytetrahydropterin synthase